MIAWLARLINVVGRDRHDPALDQVASKFGTKPVRPEWKSYDFDKALAGARKARTQTETGRPIRVPKPVKQARVLTMPRRASK